MSKHSPGPWVVFHSVEIRCPSEDNTVIARMEDSREAGWNTPTINANARLIAVAPDMYAALCSVVALLNDPDADGFEARRVERNILNILSKVEAV